LRVDLPDGRRIEYAYDSSGMRTEKRVNGRVVEAYRWLDPLRLSEFHDGREWWRLAYDNDRPGRGSRTPVGVTNGEDSYFLLCDQVGTPLALATPNGHVVQTMQYDSFGNLLQVRGDVVRLPIGSAGGLFDADTGLTRFVWCAPFGVHSRPSAPVPWAQRAATRPGTATRVDAPVNRVDAWGLEDSWWDGAGGRIVRSGLEGMGTGAISGAGAGALAGGFGAAPGAVVGASVGLPVGLLKGVGGEVYQQYWGDSAKDTAKELSDTMSGQTSALRKWFWR